MIDEKDAMSKILKKNQVLPINIIQPDRVMFPSGVMFVTLRTLNELEKFWAENKNHFMFACEGKLNISSRIFLREYEWVFGNTKHEVLKAVLRWDALGIRCEFYDWASDCPNDYEQYFVDREAHRSHKIGKGCWSYEDEVEFIHRTRETYRGWWRFSNLPKGSMESVWFNLDNRKELFDSAMPLADVEKQLLEQAFDDWKLAGNDEIESYDHQSIEDVISYWNQEKIEGQGYYGDENEVDTGIA